MTTERINKPCCSLLFKIYDVVGKLVSSKYQLACPKCHIFKNGGDPYILFLLIDMNMNSIIIHLLTNIVRF